MVEKIVGDIPSALCACVQQSSGAPKIRLATGSLLVLVPVVLMHERGPLHPEIHSTRETTIVVPDLVLRLDANVHRNVEQAKKGLPGRLRSRITQGGRLSEAP
jgi:hypothetical protein